MTPDHRASRSSRSDHPAPPEWALPTRFTVGGVLVRTARTLRAAWWRLLLVNGAFVLLSAALLALVPGAILNSLALPLLAHLPGSGVIPVSDSILIELSILAHLSLGLTALAVNCGVVTLVLREGRVGLWAGVRRGVRALGRLVLAVLLLGFVAVLAVLIMTLLVAALAAVGTILTGIAAVILWLVLVIAGVFLAAQVTPFLPAVVAEGLGPFGAWSRAWALGRGHRWHLFGLLLVAITVLIMVQALSAIIAFGAGIRAATLLGPLVGVIGGAATTSVLFAAIAAVHHDLWIVTDGPPTGAVADVFA